MSQRLKARLEKETNATVFNRLHRSSVSKCSICAPHRGCNRNFRTDRNWKNYRKNQYRNESKS